MAQILGLVNSHARAPQIICLPPQRVRPGRFRREAGRVARRWISQDATRRTTLHAPPSHVKAELRLSAAQPFVARDTMDSLQHELSDLFHRRVAQVRKTRGIPPRISVIDLAMSLKGKSFRGASRNVGVVKERYPEFSESLTEHKFPGQRQRVTPMMSPRHTPADVPCVQGARRSLPHAHQVSKV